MAESADIKETISMDSGLEDKKSKPTVLEQLRAEVSKKVERPEIEIDDRQNQEDE